MKKIPLEATIVGAYRFLFRRIVSIIGTIWFPTAVLFALIAGLIYALVPHAWLHGNFGNVSAATFVIHMLPKFVLAALLVIVVALIVRAMVTVGVLRHALGLKTSTTLIYFSLGARVWRMVAVILLTIIAVWVLELAVLAVLGLTGAIISAALPNASVAATSGIYLVVGVIMAFMAVYVFLRLFFFLPAVVVAENKVGLGRSWSLGGGNVWRMVVVLIAVVVPAAIVFDIILYLTILPAVIIEAVKVQPKSPEQAMTFLRSLLPLVPIILGIFAAMIVAMTGLVLGAVGSAYQAVAAPEAPAEGATSA